MKFYGIWAKLRLRLTGRPDLDTLLAERQQTITSAQEGRCRINGQKSC